MENLKTLIENKEQVIFFSIHQSNWELLVPVIDQLGISVGAIYRHINNKFIDQLILKKRNQSINSKRSFYTPKGKESAKEILSAINNNFSMILLIDQKDSAGDKVNLDGETANKQGKSTCMSIFALVAFGDCSIKSAMKDGGITKIHHVDSSSMNVLYFFFKYETIVYGE